MKKTFISAIMLCATLIGYSQLLNVASVEKVTLPEGVAVNTATMSPDGSFIAITQKQTAGIHKLNLATSKITTISETGSGYGLTISKDGQQVVFKDVTTGKDKLRRTALKSANLATGKITTLVKPTRNLQGFTVSNNTLLSVDNGKIATKSLNNTVAVAAPVASIDHGRLMLTVNGKTTNISPQGSEGQSYLWPSVSPDGTRVLYYLSGKGAYICNLDGSNPIYLGQIRAAKWYDNETVVGMYDTDDGYVITTSQIVAVKADGKIGQNLTEESSMAMYPTVSSDGSKIAYITPAGDLHIINITK